MFVHKNINTHTNKMHNTIPTIKHNNHIQFLLQVSEKCVQLQQENTYLLSKHKECKLTTHGIAKSIQTAD